MTIPPIIERELRVALWKKQAIKMRLGFTGFAFLFTLFALIRSLASKPTGLGLNIFEILLWMGLYAGVIETGRVSTDLFASERRNQTLPLLFLSGMTVTEVFLCKLFSGALVAFYNLHSIQADPCLCAGAKHLALCGWPVPSDVGCSGIDKLPAFLGAACNRSQTEVQRIGIGDYLAQLDSGPNDSSRPKLDFHAYLDSGLRPNVY